MVGSVLIWHGTPEEAVVLATAIQSHCLCEYDCGGVRVVTCAPHKAMATEQTFLDGMLYGHRLCAQWLREEGIEKP